MQYRTVSPQDLVYVRSCKVMVPNAKIVSNGRGRKVSGNIFKICVCLHKIKLINKSTKNKDEKMYRSRWFPFYFPSFLLPYLTQQKHINIKSKHLGKWSPELIMKAEKRGGGIYLPI